MSKDFKALKKNLKAEVRPERQTKIAVLADSSSQLFCTALEGYGIEQNIDFKIFESDYDQIAIQVFNENSELYSFEPQYSILYKSSEKLLDKFYKTKPSERAAFAQKQFDEISAIYDQLSSITSSKLLLFNFIEIIDGVFGHYANKVEGSFLFQVRKLNFLLMEKAQKTGNLFVFDICAIQSQFGNKRLNDEKFYYGAKMTLGIDILPIVAKELTEIILAINGQRILKCLILDLDNTMWGGVIGDDGIEGVQIGSLGLGKAFSDLQNWALELKNRGVILCVCSKNTDHIAKEPFEKHPDMVLRLDDISVFVANWENKADNIRHIKEVLNIGYDSMVFLDDNPFERNLVRTELPEVTVPELPKDPAEYMSFIRGQNLFETASFSQEDGKRTQRYQEEAKRLSKKKSYKSIGGYLGSLEMEGKSGPFSKFSIPRVAQLTQRSNQFNLRTIRYTEQDIKEIAENDKFITNQIYLNDKFGEYGLISVVIGKIIDNDLFLDTWIMSCRVLKRDVEKFVLNELVNECKLRGIENIVGEWLETKKNIIVKDHYKNLGFEEKDNKWYLPISSFKDFENYILKVEEKLV